VSDATLVSQLPQVNGALVTKRGFVRCEETARLDAEALLLRSSGLTYEEIAVSTGCSRSTALRRCQRALGAIPQETAEEYRKLEDVRLDHLYVIALGIAERGNLAALDRCIAISARRSRLLGLDLPPEIRRASTANSNDVCLGELAKESVMQLLERLDES
jgi:hypothetical protein